MIKNIDQKQELKNLIILKMVQEIQAVTDKYIDKFETSDLMNFDEYVPQIETTNFFGGKGKNMSNDKDGGPKEELCYP